MENNCSQLSDLTESLGILSLDNLKGFGESSTNSSSSGVSSRLSERLHQERLKALETLQKSEQLLKGQQNQKKSKPSNIANKENIKRNMNANKNSNSDFVPLLRPPAINISELITDKSINLECSRNTATPSPAPPPTFDSKVSFEPAEITARSTHYSSSAQLRRSQTAAKRSIAASRLSVGDILASSFAPKARDLCEALRLSNASELGGISANTSSSMSWNAAANHSLPRTADMSRASSTSSRKTFSVAPFSLANDPLNESALESEDFQPAELLTSKLLSDEISWAQEFAAIPTTALSKEAKAKNPDQKDFDAMSINSSLPSMDSNFSISRFFNQRSEDLRNIVRSISPERLRTPIALVDESTDNSTMTSLDALDTPIATKQKPRQSTATDVSLTPKPGQRTYTKSAPETSRLSLKDSKDSRRHESKDSGNGTREDDSYLFTLSGIDRMLNTDLDTDVSDAAFIEQLMNKIKRRPKSPVKREYQKSNDPTAAAAASKKKKDKHSLSTVDWDAQLDTIADILYGNKENEDPQKKHNSLSSDTLSFSESLLNSTDHKEMQRSIGQPRSPLSPLQLPNVPQLVCTNDEGHEADVDEWPPTERGDSNKPASRVRARSRSRSRSPHKKSPPRDRKTPEMNKTPMNGKHSPPPTPIATSTQKTPTTSHNSLDPEAATLNPLSSTRLDERKTNECNDFAVSPNLSRKQPNNEDTLTPNGSLCNGDALISSPANFGSSQSSSSPVVSVASQRRGCGNCSPKVRSNYSEVERVYTRLNSSPSNSESSGNTNAMSGVAPMRMGSSSSLRSGGGVVGRSISRCSSNSEFSHRPGKPLPLKVTTLSLSWGSTRLRSGARKSMQIKNISNKRLVLRVEVHGPGYKLENMNSNNALTLQSQECRAIVVNFCPTVLGVAVGKLSFYSPSGVAANNNGTCSSVLEIPLNGYGGHCSVVAQEVYIGPLGMPFLQMGYLHELGQPLERTIKIFNKGPLLGFALLSIDAVGVRLPGLVDAFHVEPQTMLIAPNSATNVRITFCPQREDMKKIARQTKTVLTLANLRLVSGDEANRQRLRRLVERMSEEERAKINPAKALAKLWHQFPGEKEMPELELLKEKPAIGFDLLTHMKVHEMALTINDDALDETIKSSSSLYFPDEDETVLFRTVCSATPSPEPMLDRVDELMEAMESGNSGTEADTQVAREGFWTVVPDSLKFHLGEKRPVLRACLFICNSFKSRQYFEVTTNRKDIVKLEPSEGYVEPEGGHMEVEVHLRKENYVGDSKSGKAPIITVRMENESKTITVNISENARPLECAVRA